METSKVQMAMSPTNSSSIETSRKCNRASPTENFQKKRKSMSVQETMDARRKSSQLHGQSITELGSSCRPTPQNHQNFIQCDVGEDLVGVSKKLIEEDLAGEDDENVSDSSDEDERDHDKCIEAEEDEEEEEEEGDEEELEDEEALKKILFKRWEKYFKRRTECGGVGAGRKKTNECIDVQKNKGGALVGGSSDISHPDGGEDLVGVSKKLIEEDLVGEAEDENVSDSSDEDEHDHDKCTEAEEVEEEEEEALEKILFKGWKKYLRKRAERGGVGAGGKKTNECTDVQKIKGAGLVGGRSDVSHPDVGEDENVSYSSDEDYHDHSKCIKDEDEAHSRRWDIFFKEMEKLGGVGAATTVPTPTITGFGAFRCVHNHTVTSKSPPRKKSKEELEEEEEELLKKLHKETFCAVEFEDFEIAESPPRKKITLGRDST